MSRGRKRHINIWHINNFSVTPVTDPPGREPDPPGRAPGQKCLCSLGSAQSTSTFDPWPPVGRPLATRSGDPPPQPGQSPEKFVYVYVPFPFLNERATIKKWLLHNVLLPHGKRSPGAKCPLPPLSRFRYHPHGNDYK